MLPRIYIKMRYYSVYNNPREICPNKPIDLLPEMNLYYKGNLSGLIKISGCKSLLKISRCKQWEMRSLFRFKKEREEL